MSQDEKYAAIILAHAKTPHGQGRPDTYDLRQRGSNPLCGDDITVYLSLEQDRVQMCHEGYGCAIATASASILRDNLHRKSLAQCLDLAKAGLRYLSEATDPNAENAEQLKKAPNTGIKDVTSEHTTGENAFNNDFWEFCHQVRTHFPDRLKCSTLPWKTGSQALQALTDGRYVEGNIITTES